MITTSSLQSAFAADLRVTTDDGCELTLHARLRRAGRTQVFKRVWVRPTTRRSSITPPSGSNKRLKGEWLIIASNIPGREALANYRKRWAIECMFGDAKTRGLNIEDTRLTNPRKLGLLMALVALAIAWGGRAAADLIDPGSPGRKSHGYFAKSWFRIGLDRIRNLLVLEQEAAVAAWRRLPKPAPNQIQAAGVV